MFGYGLLQRHAARSLKLARESSGKGSRYGQCVLGMLCRWGGVGVEQDHAQVVRLFWLAAAQNFDEAQCNLGSMYDEGHGVHQNYHEALQLYCNSTSLLPPKDILQHFSVSVYLTSSV